MDGVFGGHGGASAPDEPLDEATSTLVPALKVIRSNECRGELWFSCRDLNVEGSAITTKDILECLEKMLEQGRKGGVEVCSPSDDNSAPYCAKDLGQESRLSAMKSVQDREPVQKSWEDMMEEEEEQKKEAQLLLDEQIEAAIVRVEHNLEIDSLRAEHAAEMDRIRAEQRAEIACLRTQQMAGLPVDLTDTWKYFFGPVPYFPGCGPFEVPLTTEQKRALAIDTVMLVQEKYWCFADIKIRLNGPFTGSEDRAFSLSMHIKKAGMKTTWLGLYQISSSWLALLEFYGQMDKGNQVQVVFQHRTHALTKANVKDCQTKMGL